MDYITLFINYPFIFSKCFILDRVLVDPEPVPGIMGMMWEYSLNELPVPGRAPCTRSFTNTVNLA